MNGETTALQKIEGARKIGALIFMDQGSTEELTPLYKLDVTEMKINKEDCFLIAGKYMPKREIVDRIGDACGITFILGETKAVPLEDDIGKRVVYAAFAQGKKLMPDGTYRQGAVCAYDFDYVLRAMLDFDVTELNAQTKQKRRTGQYGKEYGPILARYILDLQKVASQRANTGARLRVIRELAGMPESFAEKEIQKPLYFGRMIQNTDYILKTPEGRAMATAKTLGVDMSALFGGRKLPDPALAQPEENPPADEKPPDDISPENNTADLAAKAAGAEEPEFPDEPTGPETAAQEETKFTQLSHTLDQIMTSYKAELNVVTESGKNPYKLAEEEFKNTAATEKTRQSMIDRLLSFLRAKGVNV
jgi:hypothetical protein